MRELKPRKRILIIDDEPLLCELVSETLKLGGYEVAVAGDGYEGLTKAQNFNPDLLLLDVTMPGLDGWQVLERLRRDPRTKGIPVVMLTAHGETELVMKSHELRVLDYFIKPMDPFELLAFIRRYTELKPE